MVAVSGKPLVRLGTMRNLKNPNLYVFLISVFLLPVQVQTDFNQERQYT
jgi:threonine/homoserine/homoserine lactone efflux protein